VFFAMSGPGAPVRSEIGYCQARDRTGKGRISEPAVTRRLAPKAKTLFSLVSSEI
jgi:hypothetical protein